MDREALVLYLENVRDLEVLKDRIKKIRSNEKSKCDWDIRQHPTTAIPPKLQEEPLTIGGIFFLTIICIGVAVLTIHIFRKHIFISRGFRFSDRSPHIGLIALAVILGMIAIILFLVIVDDIRRRKSIIEENEKEKSRYIIDSTNAINNQSYNDRRLLDWQKLDKYYENEYNKADILLRKFYSMNIIPLQRRNMAAACYLYDYMSSCKESFQMALISDQIEDGIRRIEAKLDSISTQLSSILYEQRVIRNENRIEVNRRITQNQNMIDSLKRIEYRQSNIEEYSRLAANYSEANALFGLATYLKN